MSTLWQDLRYGLRTLAKSPCFAVVAVLTLALGIGANTTIFSVINSVLLRPLPFREPERLLRILETQQSAGPVSPVSISGEDYLDWKAQNRAFEATALYDYVNNFNASGAGGPETIPVASTEANFFSVLGVPPTLGSGFAAGDDQPGKNHVAILSYGFWQRHFGGRADAVGKTIELNFQTYTVVGVMPTWFHFPDSPEMWVPLEMTVKSLGRRGGYSYRAIGRLKPGVTIAQAQADMSAVAKRLEEQFPETNRHVGAQVIALQERLAQDSRPQLLILLGAVALVLLVACANVANLLLARATVRRREIALRAVLGASRWRLIRQLLTESMMLSVAGAAVGLVGASWLTQIAQSTTLLPIPRENPIQLDRAVLLFTAAVSVAVGILFGLAPALEASRLNLNEELKSTAGTVAGPSGWRGILRNSLVVAEISMSLALLIGAGLLLRSFAEMRRADIGVHSQNILTAAVVLPETKYAKLTDRRAFYEGLLDRVAHAPGVAAAALSQQIPLEGSHSGYAVLEGDTDPTKAKLLVEWNFVTPGYFDTFRIPFLAGRSFTTQEIDKSARVDAKRMADTSAFTPTPRPEYADVAVINATMARSLWPNQDAVGKVFLSGNQPMTVIGVVGDVKYESFRESPPAEAYFPLTAELNNKWYPAEIVVRSSGAPESVLSGVRAAVHGLDSDLSLFRVRTMQQVVTDNMQDTSLQTALLGTFAVLGLVLAAVGIYGVMAYLVTQRTHEIGIRIALGALPHDIIGLVIGKGLVLTVAGVSIGLAGALGLTRVLAGLLYGVKPTDAATYASVILLLTAVALGACYIPARRAMRVDPMIALRHE